MAVVGHNVNHSLLWSRPHSQILSWTRAWWTCPWDENTFCTRRSRSNIRKSRSYKHVTSKTACVRVVVARLILDLSSAFILNCCSISCSHEPICYGEPRFALFAWCQRSSRDAPHDFNGISQSFGTRQPQRRGPGGRIVAARGIRTSFPYAKVPRRRASADIDLRN